MDTTNSTSTLPLLPVKEMVVFPHMEYPLVVGRAQSIAAVEAALNSQEKTLIVVAQRVSQTDVPGMDELFGVGAKVFIRKMERLPNKTLSLTVRGLEKVEIKGLDTTEDYQQVKFNILPLGEDSSEEAEALHREILDQVSQLEPLMPGAWPKGLIPQILQSLDNPIDHAYMLCSVLNISMEQQQEVLEAETLLQALRLVHEHLSHEFRVLTLQRQIANQAAENVTQEQHKYMLRRQLEEIQKELGESGSEQVEVEAISKKLDDANLPESAGKVARQQLERLRKLPPESQDFQLIQTYLGLIIELPWNTSTSHKLDLARARKILDEDHFDLKDIKDRIIEHLAVYKLNPKSKGAILCLVGGPGVGKTSLGTSIAKALGREFARISLGGLHDEAELRGHRRTYIGAMPGRIIQAIRRAGVNNPLILFDEVDKLGHDYRGDPAAALMEILDPSQNSDFHDNYLNLPFDLSNIFFLATANTLDTIPRPLLDRMEILRLSGYTEEEKLQIARRYLVPRQLNEVNLTLAQITIPDETLRQIISRYTREAGVRELERQVAKVVRKSALHFAEGRLEPISISPENLAELLGPERFFLEQIRDELAPGVCIGMAWTEAGGDILFIETVLTPGGKGLMLTGQLGDVMRESAQAAQSYIWSEAENLRIPVDQFHQVGVHVHVPAGSIPKDGPSAGVTIATALLSAFSKKPVRNDTAMTGEITLAGLVLPVGGIKEKVLAAHRAGLRRLILPKDNMKDLSAIDEAIKQEMEFIPVTHLKQVFQAAIP
jgi:ATP-dependent Lon protease